MAGAPPAAAAQGRDAARAEEIQGQALQLAFLAVDLRTYCPWHAALGLDHGVVAHLLLDRGRKGHIIELHEAGEGSAGLQSHHLCHVVPPVKHARERSAMVWNARAASEAAGRGG